MLGWERASASGDPQEDRAVEPSCSCVPLQYLAASSAAPGPVHLQEFLSQSQGLVQDLRSHLPAAQTQEHAWWLVFCFNGASYPQCETFTHILGIGSSSRALQPPSGVKDSKSRVLGLLQRAGRRAAFTGGSLHALGG